MVQPLTHGTMTARGLPRRLLVVQHNALARRSMARYFSARMGPVLVAESPAAAELYLRNRGQAPTDLLCGQRFGAGMPLGTQLIPRWRRLCPSLERVALVTADDDLPEVVAGIDAVFRKPIDPSVILSFLLTPDPA